MSAILLRGGIEIEGPLELALEFLTAYAGYDFPDPSGPTSFEESDLRAANRDGARISAVEIAAILERRRRIESVLRELDPASSLEGATGSVPWEPLTRLFDSFAEIKGVGYSKMTKTLHRKRPALIPILDSVVQTHLTRGEPPPPRPFGEHAAALVRLYKEDLDRNSRALAELQATLAGLGHRLTKVRILDLLIWSVSAPA
jgi:Family of unknown function (DUF6308)